MVAEKMSEAQMQIRMASAPGEREVKKAFAAAVVSRQCRVQGVPRVR